MEMYSVSNRKNMLTVSLVGSISSVSYPELEKKILRDMTHGMSVIFNLEGVDSIGAMGFFFLLRMRDLVGLYEGSFLVYSPKEWLSEELEVMRGRKTINVYGNSCKRFRIVDESEYRTLLSGTGEPDITFPERAGTPGFMNN